MADAQRRWKPHEIDLLAKRRAERISPKAIAEELSRTLSSVMKRIDIDSRRRSRANKLQHREPVVQIDREPQYVRPPHYVLREREIRYSIPRTSATAVVFCDPIEGYSGLDNKVRKISVQDALEICALYTGMPGELTTLGETYGVDGYVIQQIINGRFFERLLPSSYSPRHNGEPRDDD